MKLYIFPLLLTLILSLEPTDLIELEKFGSVDVQGESYLYLDINEYKEKDSIFFKFVFTGKNYSNFFIYYAQSNDLNITNAKFIKKTSYIKSSSSIKNSFSFQIDLKSKTEYLLIGIPAFTNNPNIIVTVTNFEYNSSGMVIFFIIFFILFILIIFIFIFLCRRSRISSSKIEDQEPTIPSETINPPPQPIYPNQPIDGPQSQYPPENQNPQYNNY